MALAAECLVQPVRAAVAIVRHDQQVARLQQLHEHVQRRHTGRGYHGPGTAFERGERISECVAGRVARARIVVFALFTEAGKRIVRRQV